MSPLERSVTRAVGLVQPGAAVDFGVIMQIMSMVLQFIQQCPFGNARKAMRDGALEAKVAAYRAVKASGYDGNPVDLTNALIEQGRQATDDELEATIASAHALPPLLKPVGAILAACLVAGSTATAGPFPERTLAAANGHPFPVDGNTATTIPLSDPVVEPPEPDSRIPNPSRRFLRQQIAEYSAAGGGTVGVRGMTIMTHLLRDHGWSAAQLTGLSADELYLLHGMQHSGRIDPRDVAEMRAADDGSPVSVSGQTVRWSADGVTWTNLGGGLPVEGQLYTGGGRSFVYRNGRMHAAGAGRTGPSCAGGRCRER